MLKQDYADDSTVRIIYIIAFEGRPSAIDFRFSKRAGASRGRENNLCRLASQPKNGCSNDVEEHCFVYSTKDEAESARLDRTRNDVLKASFPLELIVKMT